jgi:hypothetical protein
MALNGTAPQHLNQFVRVADLSIRRKLRSVAIDHLLVPAVKLSSIGNCAFLDSGVSAWNRLPADWCQFAGKLTIADTLQAVTENLFI